MSYSLIYDKQFIKLDDNLFIPMILAGDNNLYEHSWSGRERRVRSWQNFSFITRGKIACSLEDMLEKMSSEKDSIEGSGLKINGSPATFGTYTGIAKTGCKKALTIEQLKEENVSIRLYTWDGKDTNEKLAEAGLERINFYPKSTEELLDFIENVEPKYKDFNIYIDYSGMSERTPKWLRRKYFTPEKKVVEKKEVLSRYGYTVLIREKDGTPYGYLSKYRGGTFYYAPNETGGRQFIDKKEAEKFMAKIAGRRAFTYNFEVILVEYGMERRFVVPANKNITLPEPEPEKKMTDEELIASLMLKPEGEEVKNFFDPEQKCFLDPLGVALHDFIKGCEYTGTKQNLMAQALSIFREKYPEEYYTLLD